VRQPLAKTLVYSGNMRLSEELVEVVLDELNVKTFEWVDTRINCNISDFA